MAEGQGDSALALLMERGKPLQRAPRLVRLNGVGLVMGRGLRDPRLGEFEIATIWLTFLFLPVYCAGAYLVSIPRDAQGRPQAGVFSFLRRVTRNLLKEALGEDASRRLFAAAAFGFGRVALICFAVIGLGLAGVFIVRSFFAKSEDDKAPGIEAPAFSGPALPV